MSLSLRFSMSDVEYEERLCPMSLYLDTPCRILNLRKSPYRPIDFRDQGHVLDTSFLSALPVPHAVFFRCPKLFSFGPARPSCSFLSLPQTTNPKQPPKSNILTKIKKLIIDIREFELSTPPPPTFFFLLFLHPKRSFRFHAAVWQFRCVYVNVSCSCTLSFLLCVIMEIAMLLLSNSTGVQWEIRQQ